MADTSISRSIESTDAFDRRVARTRVVRQVGQIVLYTVLSFLAFVALLPFLWMISQSLMTLGETLNRQWVPSDPQWGNYVEAWNDAEFSRYFSNSVIITFTTISGLLFTSILSAYAFARINFVGRNTIFTLLLATLMIPELVIMIPNFLTITGNISFFPLPQFNFTEPPIIKLGGSWFNMLPALTIPFMANAFSIFLLRQFFAQIPDELWDAARIDGAGHLRFLVQICLPIVRPALMTVALLTFIASWNALIWPLIVTRTDDWRPLVVGLYNFKSDQGPQTHLLMAASFITTLPILFLYFMTQKTFTESVANTGIK